MEKISIVLLNYNGSKHLETYLPSVVKHSGPHKIYLVDNGSTDDSLSFLKENFPQIELISFKENHGFCGGYNRAIKMIDAEYVVLLNTDVEVTENWIDPILQKFEADPDIRAIQPKILSHRDKDRFEYAGAAGGFIDIMGYPFCRGRIFETLEKDEGQYNDAKDIFWASGSCLFIHQATYMDLGGLDEDFFAHMEEIDLCWKIWNAGYKVHYCPQSTVYHLGGGTLDKSKPKKTYLNFRNGLSLILKNERAIDLCWKLPLRLALDWVALIKFSLQSGPQHGLAIVHAHLSTLFKLPGTLRKRSRINRKNENIPFYKGFITWQYFVRGNHRFRDLDL